ncbi:DUF1481 domain-containing protein [Photobacterium sp. J15]|uniref:DUF1481 domain-containing protein n=1 Tax=Photobacterium sp. J15 TaxID=265901 RepID=UPI0007E445D1|nr:DUF1481 domain-containing protein [Photobacterium sp. J15]
MKRLIPFLLLSLLAGCESTTVPENTITPILSYTTGQTKGDTTAVYWYTFQQNRPVSLSEIVMKGDYGQYQSEYRWREGNLREIKREGTQFIDMVVKPFSLHVRYDTKGSAVFQRYLVDGTVLPLSDTQLYQLTRQAKQATDVIKQQRRDGQSLVQGYWQGKQFLRCDDDKPLSVTFETALPDYIEQQLSQDKFMAVTGKVRRSMLEANQLLMLADKSQQCLSAPVLLK